MHSFQAVLSLGLVLPTVLGATPDEWRSRSIYQILSDRFARSDGNNSAICDTAAQVYCGGSYQGIIDQLDYIQGMNFDAIWLSPLTEQISRPSSYHGYWQQNINALNTAFGSAADLSALSNALHARGMYLMLDVVVNHFGFNSDSVDSVNYTSFNPFNSSDYFHDFCTINYADYENATQLQNCWTGSNDPPLPDLRTEDSNVAGIWKTWIARTISDYGIDGIRLDSAMMVNPSFWPEFVDAAGGMYMVGEVYEYNVSFVCSLQNQNNLPGVLNYPLYQALRDTFQNTSGSFADLSAMVNTIESDCKDTGLLGTFSSNHDQPRFAYGTPDMALAENIVAFVMTTDGIPIIYQGEEQHYNAAGVNSTGTDPYNREALWLSKYQRNVTLYQEIAKLNAARKNAISDDPSYLTSNNFAVETGIGWAAFRKGKMVSVFTNEGSDAGFSTVNFASSHNASTSLTEILTCDTLTVDSSGNMTVPMNAGLPRIYYPTDSVNSLCSSSSSNMTKRVNHNRWNRAILNQL